MDNIPLIFTKSHKRAFYNKFQLLPHTGADCTQLVSLPPPPFGPAEGGGGGIKNKRRELIKRERIKWGEN